MSIFFSCQIVTYMLLLNSFRNTVYQSYRIPHIYVLCWWNAFMWQKISCYWREVYFKTSLNYSLSSFCVNSSIVRIKNDLLIIYYICYLNHLHTLFSMEFIKLYFDVGEKKVVCKKKTRRTVTISRWLSVTHPMWHTHTQGRVSDWVKKLVTCFLPFIAIRRTSFSSKYLYYALIRPHTIVLSSPDIYPFSFLYLISKTTRSLALLLYYI